MRHLSVLGKIVISLMIVGLAVSFSSLPATTGIGSTWQRPLGVSVQQSPFSDYRQLHSTGDAFYYRLAIRQPTRLRMHVSIPDSSSATFSPQVVVFQPYTTTIGPLLPVEQPPNTIAFVHPMTPKRELFNGLTQTKYIERLQADTELSQPGDYTLAVYNAGRSPGQFRMVMDRGQSTCGWPDMWLWPSQWWLDQTFAGFSWMTLIAPSLLALGFWGVYRLLDQHQLHAHKQYPRPVKKSTRKKKA